jgi:hypothetical protein
LVKVLIEIGDSLKPFKRPGRNTFLHQAIDMLHILNTDTLDTEFLQIAIKLQSDREKTVQRKEPLPAKRFGGLPVEIKKYSYGINAVYLPGLNPLMFHAEQIDELIHRAYPRRQKGSSMLPANVSSQEMSRPLAGKNDNTAGIVIAPAGQMRRDFCNEVRSALKKICLHEIFLTCLSST